MSKRAGERYRFVKFEEKPSESDGVEDVIFQPLQDIAAVIFDYQLKDRARKRNQFHFLNCPRRSIRCDFPGSNNKIDACMTLRSLLESNDPLHTSLIPLVAEFKTKDADPLTTENYMQCLGAANQIMNADPRRMFAYGITIESDQVSLWYYSRSHSAKSNRFSFVEEPERLVSILLTLFYSTSEELGYDPCITRCGDAIARLWDEAISPRKPSQSAKRIEQKESGDSQVKQKENGSHTGSGKQKANKAQSREEDATESGRGKRKKTESGKGTKKQNANKKSTQDNSYGRAEKSTQSKAADVQEIPYYLYELPSANGSPSVFYRTYKVIAEYRSLCITDRMIRVWEVAKVRSSTDHTEVEDYPKQVLKDVWLDKDARTEKEIQDDIFNDLTSFFSSTTWQESENLADFTDQAKQWLKELSDQERYRELFLTIECDWVGRLSKPTAPHSKRVRGLFTPNEPDSNSPVATRPSETSHRAPGDITKAISRPSLDLNTAAHRAFVPKKQYRVIFREECTALNHLGTLGEVIDVLGGVLVALQLLFCAGWVHRDVSSGNILAYKAIEDGPWNAKLSDLEFAKRYPSIGSSSDPKTGTPYFMPFEVAAQEYMYQPLEENVLTIQGDSKIVAGLGEEPSNIGEAVIVNYNFQHDLESVWWIVFWTVTCRVDHKASREYASRIFLNTLTPSQSRRYAITLPIGIPLQSVLTSSASIFATCLETLRGNMRNQYMQRVMNCKLHTMRSYSYIHQAFDSFFTNLRQDEQTQWRTIPLPVRNPLHAINPETPPPQQVKQHRKPRCNTDGELYQAFIDGNSYEDSEKDIDEVDRRKTKRRHLQKK